MEVTNYLLTGMTLQVAPQAIVIVIPPHPALQQTPDGSPKNMGGLFGRWFSFSVLDLFCFNNLLILTKMPFNKKRLGGGNSNIFYFHPVQIGEDEPNLTSIFFRWVGSKNHQLVKLMW